MCGTGWTISQEFVPKPLHILVKYISAYLTAEWAAFSRLKTQAQSCEQEQWLVTSRSWLTDHELLATRV